jgi:hypothetical protein
MEDHPGDIFVAHPGAVKAPPGAKDAHSGAQKLILGSPSSNGDL